ncbi:MAG: hypothetical protein U0L09_07660 [Christensenellales bacterium]|nr:hypothetical protein [Christensenellales bacterium]
MKKILLLVLILGLMTTSSALGSEAITMQDVYDAHQLETLLASHENVLVRQILRGKEGEGESVICMNDEFCYTSTEGWGMYVTDNSCYYREGDICSRVIYIAPDGLEDMTSIRAILSTILDSLTLKEEIQSVTEEDGRITVTSMLSKELLEELGDGEENVSSGRFEYVLDAKTHAPVRGEAFYTYEDGTKRDLICEYAYDTEMTEDMKAMMELDRQTEDLRTVTLVFYPGTEEENTVSVQVPKGVDVELYTASGIDDKFEVYTDAACTEPFVSFGEYTSDTTLYIKWVE